MIRLATQCRCAVTGKTGDFLYDDTLIAKVSASPVFDDLAAFYAWANEQGLEQYHPENEPYNPYIGAWRSKKNEVQS